MFLEKDEAAIESSEFNATSLADVDKRVKRRLLMGNSFLPLSMCCHGACACFYPSLLLLSTPFLLFWCFEVFFFYFFILLIFLFFLCLFYFLGYKKKHIDRQSLYDHNQLIPRSTLIPGQCSINLWRSTELTKAM